MASTELSGSTVVAMLAEDDLEKGRRFWRDTIGAEEIWADENYGEVAFRTGRSVFALYLHQGGSKADHTQLAFQVEDVRATKQALEQKGIRFEEYDLPGLKTENGIADMGEGNEGAWFLDPGGNIIGLFTESKTMLDALGGHREMAGAGQRGM